MNTTNLVKKEKKVSKKSDFLDYKNIYLLRKYITIQGKILPKHLTKLTSKQHRTLTKSFRYQ